MKWHKSERPTSRSCHCSPPSPRPLPHCPRPSCDAGWLNKDADPFLSVSRQFSSSRFSNGRRPSRLWRAAEIPRRGTRPALLCLSATFWGASRESGTRPTVPKTNYWCDRRCLCKCCGMKNKWINTWRSFDDSWASRSGACQRLAPSTVHARANKVACRCVGVDGTWFCLLPPGVDSAISFLWEWLLVSFIIVFLDLVRWILVVETSFWGQSWTDILPESKKTCTSPVIWNPWIFHWCDCEHKWLLVLGRPCDELMSRVSRCLHPENSWVRNPWPWRH